MASVKFSELIAQAARKGLFPNQNEKSRRWFREKLAGLNFSSYSTYEEDDEIYIMDRILSDGVREGFRPGKNKRSRSYFRNSATQEGRIPNGYGELSQDKARVTKSLEIGNMYCFIYDAKHKATLPYWDKFPLIFPCGPAPGGFYGINFHYLPFSTRAHLLDSLYSLKTNNKFDETTKIKLSYNILMSNAKFKWFKPAFKHYLSDHVESNYIYIPSAEWDIMLFLDIAQWKKKSESEVWNSTNKKLNLHKRPHKRKL